MQAQIEALGVRSCAVTGNIGDRDAVAKMKAEIEPKSSARSTSSSTAPAATSAHRAASPCPNNVLGIPYDDIITLTNNNLIGTMLVSQAFVPPMVDARKRDRGQHRLGRGASRRFQRRASTRR